jgi:hypothetical protein
MKKKPFGIAWALLPLALLAAGPALAAGGHHSVDDATILPRGECEQESWFSREQGNTRALHAGVNCRLGPVELGVAGEHARGGGQDSETAWNAEVKWAHEIADGFSVGLDLQPVWQAHQRPRHAATRFAALATWSPNPELAVHLNLGRDFVRGGPDLAHHGVGVDWTPIPRWTFTGERFIEERTHFLRAGVRWAGGRLWTLDFSRAQRLSGPSPSNWTIGLTFDLDDD